MKTNTAIAPLQANTSPIVPRPTKSQFIEVIVSQVIAEREAKNEIIQAKRDAIQKKLDAAIEKFKRTKITIGSLDGRWESAGAYVYIQGTSMNGSPVMKELHAELKANPILQTNPEWVRNEVKSKIEKEMLQAIIDQPGAKEGIRSSIAKLGL
jgi:hypothetical protein